MRFEVIFRAEPLGQHLSRVVEATSWDEAAIKAAVELEKLGKLSDDDGLPYPTQIRRITP